MKKNNSLNETEVVIMVSYNWNVFQKRRHTNIMNYYKWCVRYFFLNIS